MKVGHLCLALSHNLLSLSIISSEEHLFAFNDKSSAQTDHFFEIITSFFTVLHDSTHYSLLADTAHAH